MSDNRHKKEFRAKQEHSDIINIEEEDILRLKEDNKPEIRSLGEIKAKDIKTLAEVGIVMNENNRSGSYLCYGQCGFVTAQFIEGLECIPIDEALEKYEWLKEKYWFKAIRSDENKITEAISSSIPRGFFIRVKKGYKIKKPFQAALFMTENTRVQGLHNIVILEEDAELTLLTGCTSTNSIKKGLHLAISEIYIGKNAKLVSTMIHSWGPQFDIGPRTCSIVEEGGTLINTYCSINPPRKIQMHPFTHLKGDNASAKYVSIILGTPNTCCDIGGTIMMDGNNTGAEICARAVCKGGNIVQTGLLIGKGKNCRAHVDCAGLMLSNEGMIEATPALRALNPDARMSHEASIGRVAPGELVYLMSKGFTEEEALSTIIRGFIDPGIEGISPELDAALTEVAEISGHGEGWDMIPIRNR